MNYGIVYATGSKMIRRLIVSDDPNYDFTPHAGQGESVLVADKANGSDLNAAKAVILAAEGVAPPDPTCAIIDKNGNVVQIIAADPALDVVAGHTLVAAYVGVSAGCTYDAASATFTAPLVVTPAGVDKGGKPYPQKTTGGPVTKPNAAVTTAKVG